MEELTKVQVKKEILQEAEYNCNFTKSNSSFNMIE